MAGALVFATSAQADGHTSTIELMDEHRNQTVDYDEFEVKCSEGEHIPDDKSIDEDAWVFVLPSSFGADSFDSVTATFDDGEGGDPLVREATIVSPGESGKKKHAVVVTPGGWTLVTAFAEVTGDPTELARFNVTHVCPAGEVPDKETPTSGETPSDEATTPGEEESSPGEEETTPAGGTLPNTGTPLTIAIVAAAALAAAGSALFFVMRRRRALENW